MGTESPAGALPNSDGEQQQDEPEWPAHFPENCPPDDARDLGGDVFMLVATDPPTAEDMKCAQERNSFVGECECLRASLSCARDEEHLRSLRANVKRLRNYRVAKAGLMPSHGKIKQTRGAGHYSMWLRAKHLKIGHTFFVVQP